MLIVKNIEIEHSKELRVVMFTDLHFSKDYDLNDLENVVNKINEQEPDITVFTGDFFDNYKRDENFIDTDEIINQLSLIDGLKFACNGNHDIGGGAEFLYEGILEDGGFNMLVNESVFLEEYGINIVGIDETMFGEPFEGLPLLLEDSFNLVLLHQPDFSINIEEKFDGLVLSGHSHGGQVYVPFLTNMLMPEGAQNFTKGMYENVTGDLDVYVSSGLGTTMAPIRFLNPPEIVVFDFKV